MQAFFFFLVLHLWTTFFQGAWRDGRGATWVVGMLCFLVGIGTAFTGYISQQNFDAQWIAEQGKDAMNAIGIGAFFNVLNFGQMYGFHIVLLPVLVSALVGLLSQTSSRFRASRDLCQFCFALADRWDWHLSSACHSGLSGHFALRTPIIPHPYSTTP